MNLQQGQIWLTDFEPSFGHEYQKVRPALIIENSNYINISSLITLIPISSVTDKKKMLDIEIPKSTRNRLMKDSLIKTCQISTFDKRRLIKYIGECEPAILLRINDSIMKYLNLSR
jgi:mRNA interferase MazF